MHEAGSDHEEEAPEQLEDQSDHPGVQQPGSPSHNPAPGPDGGDMDEHQDHHMDEAEMEQQHMMMQQQDPNMNG